MPNSVRINDSGEQELFVAANPGVVSVDVGGSPVGAANPVPADAILVDGGSWTTLFNAQRIDDDPTTANSAALNVDGYSMVAVDLLIDSTLSPTTLQLIPQFTVDGGTTWADFVEGFWASLFWEDTATASGLRNAFRLPVAGWDSIRFRIVGVGTDATNYFDVTLRVRQFRGAFAGAHA